MINEGQTLIMGLLLLSLVNYEGRKVMAQLALALHLSVFHLDAAHRLFFQGFASQALAAGAAGRGRARGCDQDDERGAGTRAVPQWRLQSGLGQTGGGVRERGRESCPQGNLAFPSHPTGQFNRCA